MNRINVSLQQSIIALVERGWSKRRIARELQLDRATVRRQLLATANAATNPAIGSDAAGPPKAATNPALCSPEVADLFLDRALRIAHSFRLAIAFHRNEDSTLVSPISRELLT